MSRIDFDLIVVGAGPAGAVAAICAQRNGAKVALLERSSFSVPRPGEHLPPHVVQKLRELEMWSPHEGRYAECCAIQSAWGSDELMDKSFMMGPYGYGQNIDRCTFDQINFSAAKDAGVFAVKNFDAVIRFRKGKWRINGVSSRGDLALVSPLVVDATGRSAAMSRHVGATDQRFDQLIGIQAVLSTQRTPSVVSESHSCLMIESMPDGWWYALRLSDSKMIATFLTDADLLSAKHCSTSKYWTEQLSTTKYIRKFVDGFSIPESTRVVPAFTRHLLPCQTENYIAIGDAAISLDPLSSRGIGSSIETAIIAERAIRCADLVQPESPYQEQVVKLFEDYLLQHRNFYAIEQRWPSARFWNRRNESKSLLHHESATIT